MVIVFTILFLLISLLVFEKVDTARKVHQIRLRIHVNGTRGKSSVTRYIAAGLRAGGRRTFAKITGTVPTLVFPDGSDRAIQRPGPARVQEQFTIIRYAAQHQAKCLALECMSLQPELQKLEGRIFRPHILVLTAITDDHREHLGIDPIKQAESICEAIPEHAVVVAEDGACIEIIRRHAARKNCDIVVAALPEEHTLPEMPDGVFASNIALALTACREAGVDSTVALPAILAEARRIADKPVRLEDVGPNVTFINGFAVNDVPSAIRFIDNWREKMAAVSGLVIILNTRNDRPIRSRVFAEWLAGVPDLISVILTGNHIGYTTWALKHFGLNPRAIHVWKGRQINVARDMLKDMKLKDTMIVGLGNIHGDGFKMISALGPGA